MTIILTEQQTSYIQRHFGNTRNEELLAGLEKRGLKISLRTLVRKARSLGLKKSRQFMRKQGERNIGIMLEHNERTGYEMSRLGAIRQWKRYRETGFIPAGCFKTGESSAQRLGEERERARIEKAHATRRRTIQKERRRMELGLEQKTNLRLETRFSTQDVSHRYRARKLGYLVFEEDAIYYTKNTDRAKHARFEQNVIAAGTQVLPIGLRGKSVQVASLQTAGAMTE